MLQTEKRFHVASFNSATFWVVHEAEFGAYYAARLGSHQRVLLGENRGQPLKAENKQLYKLQSLLHEKQKQCSTQSPGINRPSVTAADI